MSRSKKFALLVASKLRDPSFGVDRGKVHGVDGWLNIGAIRARIEVFVPWFFRDLRRVPPLVRCTEPWMKKGADWHNDGTMCWVLHDEWRDYMNWGGKPAHSIVEEGVEWLLNGVRNLANRHYLGHLLGIEEWPEEWNAWSHDMAGVREYRREKRKKAEG